ncbi:MAG: hypothetical protein ACOZQL_23355 [Myxococcota bacterium]
MRTLLLVSLLTLSSCVLRIPGLTTGATVPAASSGAAIAPSPASESPLVSELNAFIEQLRKARALVGACCAGKSFFDDLDSKYPSLEAVEAYLSARRVDWVRFAPLRGTPAHATMEAERAGLLQDVTAMIRLPAERYRGADARKVRDAFAKEAEAFTGKQVRKVLLMTADWNRVRGVTDQGRAYDEAEMSALAVVDEAAPEVSVWRLTCRRDYLDAQKLKCDTFVPYEAARMLAANLPK